MSRPKKLRTNSKRDLKFGQQYAQGEPKKRWQDSNHPMLKAIASLGGRPRAFATPEALLQAFFEYVQWAYGNPLKEEKAASMKGIPTTQKLKKKRLISIIGFMVWSGNSEAVFRGMRKADFKHRERFGPVLETIEDFVKQDQIEGATSDLYNANIITRLQGLKERIDHTSENEKLEMPAIQMITGLPDLHDDEKQLDRVVAKELEVKAKRKG